MSYVVYRNWKNFRLQVLLGYSLSATPNLFSSIDLIPYLFGDVDVAEGPYMWQNKMVISWYELSLCSVPLFGPIFVKICSIIS